MFPRRFFLLFLSGFFALFQTALGAPTLTVRNPAAGTTVGSLSSISITFSEAVTGVDASDLEVNADGTLLVTGSGAGPYVFTFTQPPAGTVSVQWSADHGIVGQAGTGAFVPTDAWTYTLTDTIAPTASTLTPAANSTVGALSQVEVTFSETVTGVDAGDLTINGSPASGLTGSGPGPYVFTFPQPAVGTVTFAWAAGHGIADIAAVPNGFAGGTWTVTRSAAGIGNVIINEFLAVNGLGLTDEDGEYSDWIELYNAGSASVNLAGWALTNEKDTLGKWVFPSRTIGAGSYLVVFASDKNRKPASGNLHTNFNLNENGDYLALVSPESPRVAVSAFDPHPAQRTDYSYGRQTDGALRYFSPPTPGAANGNSSLTAITPQVNTSVGRGVFKESFALVLSCSDPTASIRYTTNFTEPTVSNGTVYSGPITISATTVLRAVAFGSGKIPSLPVTHSYLFLDQVLTQSNTPAGFPTTWGTYTTFTSNIVPADYEMDSDPVRVDPLNSASAIDAVKQQRLKDGLRELPIVSLTLPVADIFLSTGLYYGSTVLAQSNVENKTFPLKKCAVEMLLPDGSTAFSTTCGISGHGNASRVPAKNPKHGFQLKFKGDFGPGALDYPIFPDSAVEKYDDIILRPDFGTSWRHQSDISTEALGAFQRSRATRTRDAFVKDTFRDMGRLASHHRFFHLFIDGIYWGVYDFAEQPVEGFIKSYFGGAKADYAIYHEGNPRNGADAVYTSMTGMSAITTNALYDQMKGYLDVTQFIDYHVLQFFVGALDWGNTKNWYAFRRRATTANPTEGKYQYVPWDEENTLLDTTADRVNSDPVAGYGLPSGLHAKLLSHPQYKLDFADRVHKHVIAPSGALTLAANVTRWQKWQAILDKPIVAESCRWGDYRRDVHPYTSGTYALYTRENQWLTENARLTGTYLPARAATLIGQLQTAGLYPPNSAGAPEFRQTTTSGAIIGTRSVAAGSPVAMSVPAGSSGTIYYTTNGVDPHIYYTATTSATAATVAGSATAYSAPLTINATTTVKARILSSGGTWSALNEATFTVGVAVPQVAITEIMYNPPGGTAHEFIEIRNTGATAVDLGGWYFEGVSYYFPFATVLNAGDRLVIANEDGVTGAFAAQYPGVAVFGWFGGSLDNGGERLVLHDAAGRNVSSVLYDDVFPWPTSPDGGGTSLELIDPAADADDAFNWKASATLKGSPGQGNSTPTSTVRINEVLARNLTTTTPAGVGYDYVELQNTSPESVNIGGWKLNTLGATASYTFPANTILPPSGFVVAYFAPGTGASLPDKNGSVALTNASNAIQDGVRYGAQIADRSLGRVDGVWTLCLPSPEAANSAVALAPASNLALNEWLANSGAGSRDWLEVYNKHATLPAALNGLYFQAGIQFVRYSGLSFISPQGFVQLFADEGSGVEDLDFTIDAAGTTLSLLDGANTTLDTVSFGAQTADVTAGRLPNGTGAVTAFPGSSSPAASNYLASSYSGPVLHEVLARNVNGAFAPWDARADWCELFNPAAGPVDLGGYRLGRTNDFLTAWPIPPGTSVAASGYLAFWCDQTRPADSTSGTDLNTGFTLGDLSDGLYLFNSSGQLVSYIEWGPQVEDRSIGRDSGVWKLLASPTRAAANSGAATLGAVTQLRINEWAAALPGSDWFELYNLDANVVAMGGLYLSNDPSELGRVKFQIAALSYIAGRGWMKWEADNARELGRNHVNFSLDADAAFLRLSNNNASFSAIDVVSFGAQAALTTQGRILDGSANIVGGLTPTPGAKNVLLPGPSFTAHPQGRTVAQGTNLTMTVTASGSAPLSYQWQVDGVNVSAGNLTGATTATLTITGALPGNEGAYTCVVTNSASSATSNPAPLVVTQNFSQWAASSGLSGTNAEPGADPDGDGITNIAEFFHHLSPTALATAADRASLGAVGIEPATGTPQYLTLSYRKNARATLTVELQASATLDPGSFTTITPDVTEQLGNDPVTGDAMIRVKALVGSGETRKFLRLRLVP